MRHIECVALSEEVGKSLECVCLHCAAAGFTQEGQNVGSEKEDREAVAAGG